MAPEHLEAEGVGTPADIYALTCLAYRDADRRGAVHARHRRGRDVRACRRGPARASAKRRPSCPPALDEVIAAGMAKDPDDRPPTARALLDRDAARARPAGPGPPGRGRLRGPSSVGTPTRAQRSPGRVFSGRYEIIAPISSGAMGAVYRANDRETRRRGRGQAAARPAPRRPLRDRGAPAGEPQPPARRQGARPLPGRAGPLHRHGAGPRHRPRRPAQGPRRPRPALDEDSIEYARHALRGAPVRARPADRAPRRQAAEHDPGATTASCSSTSASRARSASDETRRHDRGRHAALHGARGVRRRHRVGRQRHLQPRRDAVDADHRRAAPLRRRDEDREGRARRSRRSCARRSRAAWRCCPRCGSPRRSRSPRRSACRSRDRGGESLAQSLGRAPVHRRVIEAIVRTAAGMFEAAAARSRSPTRRQRRARVRGGVGRRRGRGRRHAPAAGRRARGRGRGERRGRRGARSAARTRASPPRSRRRPATCRTRCSSRRSSRRAGRSAPSRCSTAATAARTGTRTSRAPALFADLAVVALDLDTFPLSTTGGRTLPLD